MAKFHYLLLAQNYLKFLFSCPLSSTFIGSTWMILAPVFSSLQAAEGNYRSWGLQLWVFGALLLASGHWAWQLIALKWMLINWAALKH